jgi:hypothetical protein
VIQTGRFSCIAIEKLTYPGPLANDRTIWLYQLQGHVGQDFEKVGVDLSLAYELRATLIMRALSNACFARQRTCPFGITL